MNLVAHLSKTESEARSVLPCFWGDAEVFDDGDRYVSFSRVGASLLFREGRLDSIFLYRDGVDGFARYEGDIPFGLTFEDSEQVVLSKLSRAAASQGGVAGLPFPKQSESNWILFRLPKYGLHVEFTDSRRTAVRLFTVMQRQPGAS